MENLKMKLQELEYYVIDRSNKLIVAKEATYDESFGGDILHGYFETYYLENKKFKINYLLGQIPVEKEFNTIEELIDFVKEVFPID